MKTSAVFASAVLLALSFSSCSFYHQKYVRNETGTVTFLTESKTAPAKINVEGLYYSPELGLVAIKQESGGKLSGKIEDSFTIDGVVSGRKTYLVLVDGKWTFYSVKLCRADNGNLVGYYSESVPFSEKDQQPLTLKKIAY